MGQEKNSEAIRRGFVLAAIRSFGRSRALVRVVTPLQKGAAMPPTIGGCADLYAEVRALRLSMDKEVEAVKDRETEIREYIIDNLSKSADTGAAGKRYRAQIVVKDVARAVNWPLFWSWVRKNDRFDCLQKRLSDKAVADTMEQEKRVLPGLEVVHVPDVSITKI